MDSLGQGRQCLKVRPLTCFVLFRFVLFRFVLFCFFLITSVVDFSRECIIYVASHLSLSKRNRYFLFQLFKSKIQNFTTVLKPREGYGTERETVRIKR